MDVLDNKRSWKPRQLSGFLEAESEPIGDRYRVRAPPAFHLPARFHLYHGNESANHRPIPRGASRNSGGKAHRPPRLVKLLVLLQLVRAKPCSLPVLAVAVEDRQMAAPDGSFDSACGEAQIPCCFTLRFQFHAGILAHQRHMRQHIAHIVNSVASCPGFFGGEPRGRVRSTAGRRTASVGSQSRSGLKSRLLGNLRLRTGSPRAVRRRAQQGQKVNHWRDARSSLAKLGDVSGNSRKPKE